MNPTGAASFLPHRQQMLGAPFKPCVGLSGIMAVEVPLAVRHVHLRVTAYSSNEGHGFGRARQISLPMSALSVCVRTPLTSSVPKGQAKPLAFYGFSYFLWARVADGKWHFNSHYPTQAKVRLEWGTQRLLPVWQKLRRAILNRRVLTQSLKPGFCWTLYGPTKFVP